MSDLRAALEAAEDRAKNHGDLSTAYIFLTDAIRSALEASAVPGPTDLRAALRFLRHELSVDAADAVLDGVKPDDMSDSVWAGINADFRLAAAPPPEDRDAEIDRIAAEADRHWLESSIAMGFVRCSCGEWRLDIPGDLTVPELGERFAPFSQHVATALYEQGIRATGPR